MPFFVEQDVAANPADKRLLGNETVAPRADGSADLVQQPDAGSATAGDGGATGDIVASKGTSGSKGDTEFKHINNSVLVFTILCRWGWREFDSENGSGPR